MKKKFHANQIKNIVVFLELLLVFLISTGCLATADDIKGSNFPTNNPTPEYLFFVSPIGSIDQNSYNELRLTKIVLARGISVSIWTARMDVAEENRSWETIKQRVTLYIDGKEVSNETLMGGADGEKGGGLFRISWAPSLESGLHTSKFVFINDLGEALEYTWQFSIVGK